MLPFLHEKTVIITAPAAIIDDSAVTTTEIDTAGWEAMRIDVIIGATDIALTELNVTHSDASGSGHADITGLVSSGSSGDGRLPTATDDNGVFSFIIDLKDKKRYIDVDATVGNGTTGAFVTIMAKLYRGKQSPNSSTERGLKSLLIA